MKEQMPILTPKEIGEIPVGKPCAAYGKKGAPISTLWKGDSPLFKAIAKAQRSLDTKWIEEQGYVKLPSFDVDWITERVKEIPVFQHEHKLAREIAELLHEAICTNVQSKVSPTAPN